MQSQDKVSGKTSSGTAGLRPENEAERLAELHQFGILDTPPEAAFDDLARLAVLVCEMPMAFIGFVDEQRQWSKARVGLDLKEIEREKSFGAHTILQTDVLVVPDASKDARFASIPLVTGPTQIRFYAGMPLITAQGYAIGSISVMDREPHELCPNQQEALRILAKQVMAQLERSRVAAEKKEAELFYHSLVEGLPQNIFRKDVEGRFEFANQRFCDTLGRPLADIVGKTDFDFFPAELAKKYQEDDRAIMAAGKVFDAVESHQTPDGSKIHVHVVKTPIRDAQGISVGIQGIFWDVTERVKVEDALAYERDLLRTLLENSPDRIYFKDEQSRFIKCSRTVAAGLGINDPDMAVGKTDFDFFTAEHAQPAFDGEQRIISTGDPIVGLVEKETWLDGKVSWVLTTKMPLKNRDGKIIGTFGISKDITSLKQVEAALAYERDLLRALMDYSTDFIYFKDQQSRFLKVSKSVSDRFGLANADQIVGKTDFDFFTEEHARPAYNDEQEIIRSGKPIVAKMEKEAWPDGRVAWSLTTKMPLFNQNGEIIGTFGISKDVSAIKKIEGDLAYERDLLKALLDNLPDCIYFKDKQSRFIKVSRALPERFNMTPEQLVGKSDFDLFTAEHARPAYEDEQEIIRSGKPIIGKMEKETYDDGRTSWALSTKMPLCNFEGEVIGTFGISKDITALKETEAELAYERDLLRSLLDNVPDCIYFKDRQSRFLKAGRALAIRFGVESPELLVGKTDFDLFTEEHARPAFEDEQEIIRSGQPIIGKPEKETWPDGRVAWALTTKMPLLNKDGQVIGTFGISKDITALKQAETELQGARDMALESARLKSEFLANMSHEIRTPMNAIIGMTGLLLETELTDEQRDFADTVRSSADVLLTIINDILDFSKIESGKLTFETIDFDLLEMVEGTVELVAARAQSKGIELVSWVHHEVPTQLRGDPSRIRQVLTNLVSNAVKFTEKGEVVVRITKDEETDGKVNVRYTVIDTGIGISPKALPLMFQPFTQADGSMTRKYGGTGLGLAISKQLVELMNGQIGVESVLGKGSNFWFTVPLGKQSAGAHGIVPEVEKGNLTGLRVLIVDDNATNRQIIHHQIITWRMRNGHAASGQEALAILRCEAAAGDPYDLVILDQQMPEMDGLTLARAIKADPATTKTRLVMLTSLGLRIDQDTLKAAGISAFLVKPVKQSRLYDTLATVMADFVYHTQQSKPAPPVPSAAPAAGSPRRELTPEQKSLRILLAEDNVVNQKVALRQLQKLGYNADAVANGVEVLEATERIPYDVVLMDCQMPEMDGYEATRRLRQHEKERLTSTRRRPHYIVALTANALQGDREKCLAAGMDDYISKPVQLSELQHAMERAFDNMNKAAAQAAPKPVAPAEPAPEVLDPNTLAGLRELRMEGEPDPLAELIDLFLKDTPERLQKLQAAAAAKDRAGLESTAHSLKGSGSNLGAKHLASLCAAVEKLARAGNVEEAIQALALVPAEVTRVCHALEQEKFK